MIHGIVVCDKPAGYSSHAVVAVARKAFDTRKVGHAGTLDPMATGVLVLAVGEGLKILRYLTLDDKRYEARIALGSETDTLDAEGTLTESAALPDDLSLERVRAAARAFEGVIVQRAPVISALKQGGVPLYARARAGEAVQAPERTVTVHALDVSALAVNEIEVRVHCGKGFYVRALARDLGRALGTRGYLSALRRTQSGQFELGQSVAFEQLAAAAAGDETQRAQLAQAVIPLERVLGGSPRFMLDAEGEAHARNGRAIPLAHVVGPHAELPEAAEPVLLCSQAGELLALARFAALELRVVRGLRC